MMNEEYSHSLDSLCPEVTDIICSVLPTSSLRSLRLVNHHLGSIATKWTFQHIRLGARQDRADHAHFVKVAQLESLRPYVREVTCDTWLGPQAEDGGEFRFDVPREFLRALPLLRCFRNLTKVHLRFSPRTKHVYTDGGDAETDDFRYRVLDTVFNCVAGSWTAEKQARTDQKLFKCRLASHAASITASSPIPIRELTVSNLADLDDKRLTSSKPFKDVLAMPSLTSLQLCITQQRVDANCPSEGQPDSALWFREKYAMFANMPRTWLSPSIAANLRSLSLFSRDYWGWNPRMDFRAVLPGSGPNSGLPQLRVLALGMYVFSHEWQFDWIASLGGMNGVGGLEELYLDKCPIMVQARHRAPMDHGSSVVGTDARGEEVSFSNEGYYLLDGVDEMDEMDGETTVHEFGLRWHHVLPRWREQMRALKVFKMGQSAWNFAPRPTLDAWRREQQTKGFEERHMQTLLHHDNFRHFDRPSPPSLAAMPGVDGERYRLGTGVDEDVRYRARYVYFDIHAGPSEWRDVFWPARAHPRQPPLGDEVRRRDLEEVAGLVAEAEGRSFRGR